MNWFSDLMGFEETGYEATRSKLEVRGEQLHSRANARSFAIGRLSTPTLAELRAQARAVAPSLAGTLQARNVVADVGELHGTAAHAGALFQVASQFNLLEMVSENVTPEHGVTRYATDGTQGPACAMAAGAATVYRNYFAPVGGAVGQTAERQIDCLADIGAILGNGGNRLWTMRNGYAMGTRSGLKEVGERLAAASPAERDAIRDALRIGVHEDVEVTRGRQCGHRVGQAFCSAVPVTYSRQPAHLWEPFARLVLEGTYEATLWAGALNAARTGNRTVFLTQVGGGVFGNEKPWIVDAMTRAFDLAAGVGLDVRIVNRGEVDPAMARLASWPNRLTP